MKRFLKRYILITISSLIYGVGVTLFLNANSIVPGGVTGVSTMLAHFIPLQTGTILFLLNIPILLLGLYFFGKEFIGSTLYATFMVSFFIDFLEGMKPITENVFLAAVMGNLLIGFALGTIFKCGATTGGMDIVVKICKLKKPHMQTGSIFLVADVVVVGLSGILFKNIDIMFYAFIGLMVMSVVFDRVLYGKDEAAFIYIISNEHEKVAKEIYDRLKTGITFLKGQGGYFKQDTQVIMCVVPKKSEPMLEDIVKETDPEAFMIISGAKEIYGKGYKDFFANRV